MSKKLDLLTVHINYLVVFFLKMKNHIFLILISFLMLCTIPVKADEKNVDISFYTGTFDVIDKEGDDQILFGIEHKNPDLFRDTFLGNLNQLAGYF